MLTPEQLHALAIAAKPASKVRDKLTAKRHRIDFTVRIQGALVVNEDTSQASTGSVPAAELLAGVLASFGPRKRKSIITELIAARAAKGYSIDPEATDEATRLIRETQIQRIGIRRGAVTGKLTAEIV